MTVIEDVIAKAGESHDHKFNVNAGERLAFELETPEAGPPEFNPLLTVLDAERTRAEVRQEFFKTIFDYQIALSDLELAVGKEIRQ